MKGMNQSKKEFCPCPLIRRNRAASAADKKVGTDSPCRAALGNQPSASKIHFAPSLPSPARGEGQRGRTSPFCPLFFMTRAPPGNDENDGTEPIRDIIFFL